LDTAILHCRETSIMTFRTASCSTSTLDTLRTPRSAGDSDPTQSNQPLIQACANHVTRTCKPSLVCVCLVVVTPIAMHTHFLVLNPSAFSLVCHVSLASILLALFADRIYRTRSIRAPRSEVIVLHFNRSGNEK